jgi:hypothetical protein
MYLHTYADVTVLFERWKPTDAGSMAGLCFMGAAMAFAAEMCNSSLQRGTKHAGMALSQEQAPLLAGATSRATMRKHTNSVSNQVYGMFLSGLSLVLSLLAMLVAMTYNIWLVVAVIGTLAGLVLQVGWMTKSTPLSNIPLFRPLFTVFSRAFYWQASLPPPPPAAFGERRCHSTQTLWKGGVLC